jgi:hypothetical protein
MSGLGDLLTFLIQFSIVVILIKELIPPMLEISKPSLLMALLFGLLIELPLWVLLLKLKK